MSTHEDRLTKLLVGTGYVEIVESASTEKQVSFILRVKQEADFSWMTLVKNILVISESQGWKVHICKRFFIRSVSGTDKLVYGWTLSIVSDNLGGIVDDLVKVFLVTKKMEESRKVEVYTPPEPPKPKRAAGVKPSFNNELLQPRPQVRRGAEVTEMRMTGLPDGYDRNNPTEDKRGKGAYAVRS